MPPNDRDLTQHYNHHCLEIIYRDYLNFLIRALRGRYFLIILSFQAIKMTQRRHIDMFNPYRDHRVDRVP